MSKAEVDELETSDDDYVDPSIEKYFKKKEGKVKNGKKVAQTKPELVEESESDYEVEDEEEEEDEEEDDDEKSEDMSDENNEEPQADKDEAAEAENDKEPDTDGRKKLTMKMIENWSEKLGQEKPYQTIAEVVKAFKASLLNIIPSKKASETHYRVEGSDMFNAMVRLCMRDLLPCLLRLLNLSQPVKGSSKKNNGTTPTHDKLASSGSNWKKLKAPIKSYLTDLIALTSNVFEADILNAVLRHVRLLLNFYSCFPKLLKALIKLLITIWSQYDEKSRVISFICLYKIASSPNERIQDMIFKNLYLSFVRNAKFTSINTLPLISFMQRSLIELLSLNTKLAYEHIFIYIRQLAIHLRNALSLKKKESYQAVYNWQYVHSLILWAKTMSVLSNPSKDPNNHLQPLVYPLVQCIIGTIKLIPTPRYYPLRFHCINALTIISNATNIFIPIIPFILEVFDITDFNKHHATISVKQLNFSFILKLNKQQLQDKSFKDVLIDMVYDSLILLLQNQSHDIAFPELVLPLTIRLKDFVKKCKNANYCKVIKGLLDKIQENSKTIEERRSKVTFSIRDKKQVDMWTEKNKELGTPLSQWYSRYKTMREREIMMEVSNKDQISNQKILKEKPLVERPTSAQKEEERKEFGELFVNLSDDDSDTELLDFVPKQKKLKTSHQEDEEKMHVDDFSDIEQDQGESSDDNEKSL